MKNINKKCTCGRTLYLDKKTIEKRIKKIMKRDYKKELSTYTK